MAKKTGCPVGTHRVKGKCVTKVYKKLPKGYQVVDPARNLTQARSLLKSWPKEARGVIVQTGPSKGKQKHVFPYHIATSNKLYM